MHDDFEDERLDNRAAGMTGKRRRRMSQKTLIILLVVLVPVGLVVLCVGAGFLFLWSATEMPITAADRVVLLRGEQFEDQLEDFKADPSKETFSKQRYIDGSYDLDYEYSDDTLYVNCSIAVEKTVSDASSSFVGLWAGTKIGISFDSEIQFEEHSQWFRWGDQSRFAMLKMNGQTIGHMLITRKGTRVFYLVFSGLYFDDPGAFGEFVNPTLSRLDSYQP